GQIALPRDAQREDAVGQRLVAGALDSPVLARRGASPPDGVVMNETLRDTSPTPYRPEVRARVRFVPRLRFGLVFGVALAGGTFPGAASTATSSRKGRSSRAC